MKLVETKEFKAVDQHFEKIVGNLPSGASNEVYEMLIESSFKEEHLSKIITEELDEEKVCMAIELFALFAVLSQSKFTPVKEMED